MFFHTFSHFQSFSELIIQDFLELRGFTTVLVQRDEKKIKEKKNKPFCTLVVARLSSSDSAPPKTCFAPVQPHVALMQEALCSLGPKDLLHPLITTFANYSSSCNFAAEWFPRLQYDLNCVVFNRCDLKAIRSASKSRFMIQEFSGLDQELKPLCV